MDSQWMAFACLFVVALVVSLFMTPVASKIAWRLDAVDYPSGRRINRAPTPRMGGIAVFAGIAAMLLVRYLGSRYLGWNIVFTPSPHLRDVDYPLLGVAFVVVFTTGFIDDCTSLSPKKKLLGQIIAACIAVASGLVIGDVVNPFSESGVLQVG